MMIKCLMFDKAYWLIFYPDIVPFFSGHRAPDQPFISDYPKKNIFSHIPQVPNSSIVKKP